MTPVLQPDWPAPPRVHAVQTLRHAGSESADRERTVAGLALPAPP